MADAPIYLDYNATTPVDPAVREAMLPYLGVGSASGPAARVMAGTVPPIGDGFGNPSSGHPFGQRAHIAVERAREQLAALVGCRPDEVVFTGSGSEADNLALKGVVFARLRDRPHVVISAIEHSAIIETCRYLAERFGVAVSVVGVDSEGRVDPAAVAAAITDQTVLVSVMLANNEIGTIQPVKEIAELAHARGVLVHTDAAQAVGRMPVSVADLGVDLLTVVGHKMYAPKGVGALIVRRGVALDPLVHGGGQEDGRRSGTESVAGVVGLGAAAEIARTLMPVEEQRMRIFRNGIESRLAREGWVRHGPRNLRLSNTLSIGLSGVDGEDILARCPEIAASTGAACHDGRTDPSPVLLALGVPRALALGTIRLSMGRWTTAAQMEWAGVALWRAGRAALAAAPTAR
ncbi:MAG: cysteine desulfurase family protein [Chloroflexi bacterium]|nr:cysteine desulfurase family protein [Chloroflexota bacterium]